MSLITRLGLKFISSRNNLFPSLSIVDFFTLRRQPIRKTNYSQNQKRIIGELSGGEKQQLALNGLFMNGELVMLDEPFLGLDSESVMTACQRLDHFVSNMSGTLFIALPAIVNNNIVNLNKQSSNMKA